MGQFESENQIEENLPSPTKAPLTGLSMSIGWAGTALGAGMKRAGLFLMFGGDRAAKNILGENSKLKTH